MPLGYWQVEGRALVGFKGKALNDILLLKNAALRHFYKTYNFIIKDQKNLSFITLRSSSFNSYSPEILSGITESIVQYGQSAVFPFLSFTQYVISSGEKIFMQ